MLHDQRLTPEERHTMWIATLTAAACAAVAGGVQWGFEELKAVVARRRERAARKPGER
jgi:hypothetical protein